MPHAGQRARVPAECHFVQPIFFFTFQGIAWAALRKISIRAHSWFNWFYPLNV